MVVGMAVARRVEMATIKMAAISTMTDIEEAAEMKTGSRTVDQATDMKMTTPAVHKVRFYFYSILFYFFVGCVLLLQEAALCQSPPSFSVLCYPCPYCSLLPHNVISPTTWSSDWSYTLYLPLCASSSPSIILSFGWCVQPISIQSKMWNIIYRFSCVCLWNQFMQMLKNWTRHLCHKRKKYRPGKSPDIFILCQVIK